MTIQSTLEIQAPINRVWELTCDVEQLPAISPTMTWVTRLDEDPLQVGSRVRIKQPLQRAAVWTVTRLEEPNYFEWTTKVLAVTMTAVHEIEATPAGCRNTLRIDLSGPGSRLLERIAGRRILAAITTENEGFKNQAESGGS